MTLAYHHRPVATRLHLDTSPVDHEGVALDYRVWALLNGRPRSLGRPSGHHAALQPAGHRAIVVPVLQISLV